MMGGIGRGALGLALALAPALAADAATFEVKLGGRHLGTVELEDDAGGGTLRAVLDNTPLAVSNGTFAAEARPARLDDGRVVVQYIEQSAFTTGSESTSVIFDGARAIETVVLPESEVTALSDPAAVPEGVIHPIEAFGRLVTATGCPSAFVMYDGRRVVQVTPSAESRDGTTLTCEARYQVVAGPAHMSPLGISGFDLVLVYDVASVQSLAAMSVSTGPFELRIER